MKMIKGYEQINHPQHYNHFGRKECIEEMIDLYGKEAVITFCELTAYKYDYRKGTKPNNEVSQDENKALWYRNKAKDLRNSLKES